MKDFKNAILGEKWDPYYGFECNKNENADTVYFDEDEYDKPGYRGKENDAERQADCDFGLLGDDDLHEPVIDLLDLWEEADDRITERLAIEGVSA